MNAHDAILSAIVTALKATPALASGHVAEEASFDAQPETVTEAISVAMLGSRPQRMVLSGAPLDWATTVRVSCFARNDVAGAGGRASRALHAQVYQRLMSSPSLGGLARDIEPPALDTDTELLGTRMGVLHADYLVLHSSTSLSLDA